MTDPFSVSTLSNSKKGVRREEETQLHTSAVGGASTDTRYLRSAVNTRESLKDIFNIWLI